MNFPELTIVIPTLNEEATLPRLLDNLAEQEKVFFEVVISDGGSNDKTRLVASEYFDDDRLKGQVLIGGAGRGRQMNLGAKATQTKWLLFLHADSCLPENDQLYKALEYIKIASEKGLTTKIAGRFSLRFDLMDNEYSFGFFYYEAKAALNRKGCIHGDQGMLLAKAFFDEVGPFREDLPVMEDTFLANKILNEGELLLLPGSIRTSARRFQIEGLKERQTLNALMMNFLAIGWQDFFVKAPDVYRAQDKTKSLQLCSFFQLIDDLLKKTSRSRRRELWLSTGRYVRGQAWQLGWFLDCRKAYRNSLTPPIQNVSWLNWFDRWFEPITNNCLGNLLTAGMVRIWFATRLWLG